MKKQRRKRLRAGTAHEYPSREMSSETSNSNTNNAGKNGFSLAKIIVALLGLGALACVVASAFYGWQEPLHGSILLAVGVVVALVIFVLGIIFHIVRVAFRLALISIFVAVVVAIAGVATVLLNKNFENRCVVAWEKITKMSDTVERRIEAVEDRFENAAD